MNFLKKLLSGFSDKKTINELEATILDNWEVMHKQNEEIKKLKNSNLDKSMKINSLRSALKSKEKTIERLRW